MEIFSDEYFMREALKEAKLAFDEGEIPVGAIVVAKNKIIARAHNQTEKLNDVTAHAEMIAITSAANSIGGKYLTDCTLFITLEPCAMCAGALGWSQITRIVYGASDPKKGFSFLQDNLLHPKTITKSSVMENECGELIKKFFLNLRKG